MTPQYPLFRCLSLVIWIAATATAGAAEPAGEYVRSWLLCGPIPLEGREEVAGDMYHLRGFERNYLEAQGAEGAVQPQDGQPVVYPGGQSAWKAWVAPNGDIDLNAALGKTDGALAYAFTTFEAEKAQAAVLALGSNDGCRVWLNGEQVFDHPAARSLMADSDQIPVLLRAGTNSLLFKVENQGNAWGFTCRVLALDQDERWKHLDIFSAGQAAGQNAALDFIAPSSLVNTLITEAKVSIRRDKEGEVPFWSGPWTRQTQMALPLDTTNYGEYVVMVDATFAGNLQATFQFPLAAGTPVDYTLFADGASDYSILLDDGASDSEKWAANELQHWLAEVSGVTLPLGNAESVGEKPAIVVGWNTRTATLTGGSRPDTGDESFTYANVGGDIVILGGSQRGTMYGVMAFLENEMGVRFYTPAVTVAPKKARYSFRLLHRTEKPGIRVRNDFYFEAFNPIWAAHNRVNGAMGTREQPGGVEGYWAVHTFYPLMPPAEFFDAHPEYYSLIDGKRTHDHAQLCLTNPEVLEILSDRLKQRMRENPGNLIYSVSQNDWHGACQCDQCQAIAKAEESESGPLLWFVNQVAERVEKEFPDKFVGTLAYQYTRKPPKNIKPRDNVVIRLCSIECCFAHDFLTCPQNQTFVSDLHGWARVAPRIYIWDYVVSFSNYIMPFPNFSVLQPNIQTLRDNHAIGIMEQAAYQSRGGDFSELKAYLISRLLWNPEADVEPIIDDFMYGFYGRAGQYVRAYFDLVQNLVTPDTHFMIWIQPDNPLYNDDFIRQGEAILDKALSVADTPEIYNRVEMARLPLLYLKCKRLPQQAVRDGSYDRLLEITSREGVTHFAESGTPHWEAFVAEMDQYRK